jgi:hypothetical protein
VREIGGANVHSQNIGLRLAEQGKRVLENVEKLVK